METHDRTSCRGYSALLAHAHLAAPTSVVPTDSDAIASDTALGAIVTSLATSIATPPPRRANLTDYYRGQFERVFFGVQDLLLVTRHWLKSSRTADDPASPCSTILATVTGRMHSSVVGEIPIDGTFGSADISGTIASLHDRLDLHFRELATRRKRALGSAPVYALEHGFSEGDLSVLRDVVKAWIGRTRPPRKHWLPFIIYATEIGYSYEGDEYWPTLEAEAPGWEQNAGRQYVKERFQEFERDYNGARPLGRWASQFTIICWPITHAVLPADLQRQFARLLYDYRGALTSELLNDASELGRVLAARSYGSSKRFQQFAQNTELLGQVASALLTRLQREASLEPLTLTRITDDLSQERQARSWLTDAQSSADQIRLRGFKPRGKPFRTGEHSYVDRPTSPVAFSLHPGTDGCVLRLRVPDFTPLFARHPDAREQVGMVRCSVAGSNGRPKARGWLLYSGQQAALEKWPGRDSTVFELERGSTEVSELLAAEARTPPNEPWLFRLGPDGTGRIVRSNSVRVGVRYILIGPNLAAPAVDWINEYPAQCAGATALSIDMPQEINPDSADLLRDLGCSIQTSVEVEPVGIIPAAWDGAGFGEWIAGDRPMLRLSSTHDITTCTLTLNEADHVIVPWTSIAKDTVVIQVPELSQGLHDLRFSFLVPESTHSISDLHVRILIRDAEPGRINGTFRDPLRIRLSPQEASLEDLWDDRASIEIEGPLGTGTSVKVKLKDATNSTVAERRFQLSLPTTAVEWRALFDKKVRQCRLFQNAYDNAWQLEIVVSNTELGEVRAVLERELEPLRWGFRRVQKNIVLRLYESADTGMPAEIVRYPFETPDVSESTNSSEVDVHNPDGGLFVARLGDHEAMAILPPKVQELRDLGLNPSNIHLQKRKRSGASVMELVHVAALWSGARSPGHLLVRYRRVAVEAAIRSEIGTLIGGGNWSSLEQRHTKGELLSIDDLTARLAKPSHWAEFCRRLFDLAHQLGHIEDPPVQPLASLIGEAAPAASGGGSAIARQPGAKFTRAGSWLAEALLRLASSPGSLLNWTKGDSEVNFNEVLEHPHAFRAARMLAIIAEQQKQTWQWD